MTRSRSPLRRNRRDLPFGDEQQFALGTCDLMIVRLAVAEGVVRKRQRRVPQRTRPQRPGGADDFPVEAGQRGVETGVPRRLRQRRGAGRIEFQPADDLTRGLVQIVGQHPVRVALEQPRQAEPGDAEGDGEGEETAKRKTNPQRKTGHTGVSGII